MIQHQRSLNMYPGVRAPERIHLSQYDSDFTLVFNLYSSAGSFSVESGTTAMIRGTKGDGNGYSASASLSGNTVTVQGNNQMTAVAGPNTFELALTRSGKVLSTANFILDVEPAAMDANTIQSDSILMELQAIIGSASTSTAAAARAEEAAQAAEGHANGTVRFDTAQSLTAAQKAQAHSNIGIDNTLTVQGIAADAKKVGDEISDLKGALNSTFGLARTTIKQLETGQDLNFLTTPGTYAAINATLAQSLLNAPFDIGFSMIVANVNGGQTASLQIAWRVGYDIKWREGPVSGITSSWTSLPYADAIAFVENNMLPLASKYTTFIPGNADLNDYVTPGVYNINSASIAETLEHCPVSVGATLIVHSELGVDSRPIQLLLRTTDPLKSDEFFFYTRIYTAGEFGEWVNVTPLINKEHYDTTIKGLETAIIGLEKESLFIDGFNYGARQTDGSLDNARNRASSEILPSDGGRRFLNVLATLGYEYNIYQWDLTKEHRTLVYSDWVTPRTKEITAPWYSVLFRKADNSNFTDTELSSLYILYEKTGRYNSYGEYYGKKLSILGDSISTYGGDVSIYSADDPRYADGTWTYLGNKIRYPQNNLLTDVADTYWYIVMSRLGMTLGVNDSIAGSRCSWNGTTETTEQGVDKHAASMTRIGHLGENGTPDYILVNIGTNDQGGSVELGTVDYTSPETYTQAQIENMPVNTFANAYKTMLTRLMWTYPNAKIICMTINFRKSTSLNQTDSYNEVIKEVCDMMGVPLIDSRHSGISVFEMNSLYGDTTHYNAKGMKMLADVVTKGMMYLV